MAIIETKSQPIAWVANSPLYILRMCVIESRPVVQFMFIIRYLCGAVLCAQAHQLPIARVLVGCFAFDCAIFFAYLFNGTMDVVEDRANGSRRPIAAGELEPITAQFVAALSAVVSLVLGFVVGPLAGLLIVATLCLGYLYSAPPLHLKRSIVGTPLSGILFGLLSYGTGAAAVTGTLPVHRPELFLVVLSLWTGMVGSVTKDLSDVAGDAVAGRRSVAVICGETKARIAAAGAALALSTGFLAVATLAVRTEVWPATAMECGALAVAIISLSRLSSGPRTCRRRPYRAFMATQYAAHLALLVSLA